MTWSKFVAAGLLLCLAGCQPGGQNEDVQGAAQEADTDTELVGEAAEASYSMGFMVAAQIEEGFAGTLGKRSRLKEALDYSKPEQIFGIQVMANIQTALSSPNLYKAILYLLQYKAYPPGPRQLELIQDVKYDIEICHKYKGSKVENSDQKAELIFAFLHGFNLMLINKIGNLTEEEIESYKQGCVQMVLKGIVGL